VLWRLGARKFVKGVLFKQEVKEPTIMAKAEKFSVVGRRVQRIEGFDKVIGDSKFIADIFLPNMLVGKVLRSPFPHARIRDIDTSKAQKLPGVRAVFTA
jgi:CO/xanthine dehydrogenase Mo-binding subunit